MKVIDFHSHILPAVDDGSKDLSTSTDMIKTSKEQGVGCIIATPHFFASRDTIRHFLDKRNAAFSKLKEALDGQMPQILCGAEIAFFPGMSRAKQLGELAVTGTKTLLVEMPFAPWSTAEISEIETLVTHTDYL